MIEASDDFAGAIKALTKLHQEGSASRSYDIPLLTWRQNTQQLLGVILGLEGDQMVVEDSKIALTRC
jgi:hypothetical protein